MTAPIMRPGTSLPRWFRFAFAAVVGAFVGGLFAGQPMPRGHEAGDLSILLQHAARSRDGDDPYRVSTADPAIDDRLLYPLPAVVLLMPVAHVRPQLVRAVWSGLAATVILYLALSWFGWHGIAIFCSRCAERALVLAQWTPWIFAGAAMPPFQLLAVAKPTVAMAVWVYRPSWWPLVGAAVLLPLAFLVSPTWMGDWLALTSGAGYYAPAASVLTGGGPFLLLAALRWRRPEARLLLAMAVVPHNYVWYEQLLLFLIPCSVSEVWILCALSWVSMYVARYNIHHLGIPEPAGQIAFRAPVVALLYLPALAMVLRRPNDGRVPVWLERRITWLPPWLRGGAPASADPGAFDNNIN
jgi:hypothetical protein